MNSNKIVKGFAWTAIKRFSIQFVLFILEIIIARPITPSEYGVLDILIKDIINNDLYAKKQQKKITSII